MGKIYFNIKNIIKKKVGKIIQVNYLYSGDNYWTHLVI